MSKTKPKEASREKVPTRSYCQRKDCVEPAKYKVLLKDGVDVGDYCNVCSDLLVYTLNKHRVEVTKVVDVASMFPPL